MFAVDTKMYGFYVLKGPDELVQQTWMPKT